CPVCPAIKVPSSSHWYPSSACAVCDGCCAAQSDHVSSQICGAPSLPPPEIAIAIEAAGAPTPNCPIAFVVPVSLNQRLPSGPEAIRNGTLPEFKPVVNSVIVPVVVMRPTALVVPWSVNQRLPSAPAA